MASSEWRKERMYGAKDTVLWALLTEDRVEGMPSFRVVGSFLREEDADQAIADHARAARLEEALREMLDEAEMCELTEGGYCLRHHSWPPCSAGKAHDAARSLLSSPGTTQRRGEG